MLLLVGHVTSEEHRPCVCSPTIASSKEGCNKLNTATFFELSIEIDRDLCLRSLVVLKTCRKTPFLSKAKTCSQKILSMRKRDLVRDLH